MAAYRFGSCRLDLEARELRVDGARVHLEPQVFDVLAYLVTNRHRLVPKTELIDAVWGSQFVSESALTSRIKSARSAIGDDGAAQQLIRTERGRGYRFVGPVLDSAEAAPRWQPAGALPTARFPLVGRAGDLDALDRLLERHRVVTISGPGGAGKSTLALTVARQQAARGAPGLAVAFTELAPVRGGIDITRAVAEATGIEGAAAGDPALLAASLAERRLLLVLDNCEHLLDGSAELVNRLLDAGAGIRILVTSREPLGIEGEAVHVLGSLGPDAATLFAERAAATGRGEVAAGDPAVVELCERLDGLPLAIELAAAQMRHLTLDELIRRLDDRLDLLVAGRPRAGARHATLARTIEWSHQLLSDASREVFERLGVFPASFDLDAAQALGGGTPVAATIVIGDLVGKSLVVHDRVTGRYRLLETIRLFAWQRLDASGRLTELTERLREHVVGRMTARRRHEVWLSASLAARNRDDLENVRVAFDASVAAGHYGDAVDLMVGLSTLWRNAVSYAEGLRWLDVLGRCPLAPRDRLWLHIVHADLGLGSGNPGVMARSAADALELSAEVDDPAAVVIATIYRALPSMARPEVAVAGLEEARDRAAALGDEALGRLARAFRAVLLMAAGRRAGLDAELLDLTSAPSEGYDRYISIWAGWVDALVERDGPALRGWMERQKANVHASGLRENWVMFFCEALASMPDGADHRPWLRLARDRAEAEGRRADLDCVLALAYLAVCRGDPTLAAELIGACGGGLFHDTANHVHYVIMRDRIVRPLLDAGSFERAVARGSNRPLAPILAEHGL